MKAAKFLLAAVPGVLVMRPELLLACAACYGQSDSPLAKGMNWGIFSLMAVIVTVLASVASFFVYLGKKSAAAPPAKAPVEAPGAADRRS